MAKKHPKRAKPTLPAPPPSLSDLGPDTPAQRRGTCVEPVPGCANGSKRRVRTDRLGDLHAKGHLTLRQYQAGQELRDAIDSIYLSPASEGVYVDKSPNPSAAIAVQIDRMSALVRLEGVVPPRCKGVVRCVVEENRAIGTQWAGRAVEAQREKLREALDSVADAMEQKK